MRAVARAKRIKHTRLCVVVGHRGAPHAAPGNTLVSFDQAIACGVDMIELDVCLTREKIVMVYHPSRHLRKPPRMSQVVATGNKENVSVLSFHEVCQKILPRVSLNVELKTQPGFERVLVKKVLREIPRKYLKRVLFSSFSVRALYVLYRSHPRPRLACLFREDWNRNLAMAKKYAAEALHAPFNACTPERISRAHQNGLRVMAWTVNEVSHMKILLNAGIDAICTDYPERLLRLRSAHG